MSFYCFFLVIRHRVFTLSLYYIQQTDVHMNDVPENTLSGTVTVHYLSGQICGILEGKKEKTGEGYLLIIRFGQVPAG